MPAEFQKSLENMNSLRQPDGRVPAQAGRMDGDGRA